MSETVEKRLHYFYGQFLQSQDLIDEQSYHLDRERRPTRCLHVSGIAEGFLVTVEQQNGRANVAPGTAIDNQGRQIVLAETRSIDVSEFKDETVILAISYHEEPSDVSSSGKKNHTRWHERPRIEAYPEDQAPQDVIPLARLVVGYGGQVGEPDTSVCIYSGLRLPGPGSPGTLRSDPDGRTNLTGPLHIAQDLTVDGAGTFGGSVSVNGNLSITQNVGIGTETPNEKLTVEGGLSLKVLDDAPEPDPGYGKLYAKKNVFSLQFDGVDDYIGIEALELDDVGDFTVSVWFNIEAHNPSGRSYLLDMRGDGSQMGESCGLIVDATADGNAEIHHYCQWPSGGYSEFSSNVGDITGQWHHTVMVREGASLKIYLDGKSLADTPTGGGPAKADPLTWQNRWRIGTYCSGTPTESNYWFNGALDEVAIWTRALSEEDTDKIYYGGRSVNITQSHPSDLAGYWPLGEKDALPRVRDHSGGDHHGTVEGARISQTAVSALFYRDAQGQETALGGGADYSGGTPSVWQYSGAGISFPGGNVGIGTNDPGDTLHVHGLTRLNREISAQHGAWIRLFRQGQEKSRLGLDQQDNFAILDTSDSPLVSVSNSGNVGIGTAEPRGFQVVLPEANKYVSPTPGITMAGGAEGNACIELRNASSGTPYIDFAQDASVDFNARIRLTAPGQLAIEGATLVNSSSREEKKDIASLSTQEYISVLDDLKQTPIYRYRFRSEKSDQKRHIGVMAEESPDLIRDQTGRAISLIDFSGFLLAAIKGQQTQIEKLEAEIQALRKGPS